uniref:Uncharacterized protein n=1 Tax=Solanum lycopersicum TaxID=4081 RepID=A0A3Q7H969_SOLLC
MRGFFIMRALSSLAASSKLGTQHLKMKENRERGRVEGNSLLGLGSGSFSVTISPEKEKSEVVLVVR